MILKTYFGLPNRIQKKKNNHRIQVYLYKLPMLCIWLTQSHFSLLYILVGCKNYEEKLHSKKKFWQKKLCNFLNTFDITWILLVSIWLAMCSTHRTILVQALSSFWAIHNTWSSTSIILLAISIRASPIWKRKKTKPPKNGIDWKIHK